MHFIDEETTVCWFRRDLRMNDHAAFHFALKENSSVIPLFIFDANILEDLDDKQDRRVDFIFQSLLHLKAELEAVGSSLVILYGSPQDIFRSTKPKSVYTNEDYEPYAITRDNEVKTILNERNIPFNTYKDLVIFQKDEVVKPDGSPYTVFTPYSRTWRKKLDDFHVKEYPTKKYLSNLRALDPLPYPSLSDIGFQDSGIKFPQRIIKISTIYNYHTTRDYPAIEGTSRLSVHLRFGTVSIRKVVSTALQKNDVWLNELIWREFYQMILWHFPRVVTASFKPAFDNINWRNNDADFERWCTGTTGYPLVDAGMRELNATGFMHNRVRMVVASFLTKHLLIDWRWGEAYFAKKLLDYELASNNGGWQWAAGSGCDASPYFRIFNPETQAKKFDPEKKYILKWIPEFGTAEYPSPMVDHAPARERAISVFRAALQKN
jgi:deoxyribodipyrimidine photo-lyase